MHGKIKHCESISASIKLKIQGHVLVLEVDGTPVDYDEVLMYVHDKVLLLLLKSEEWVSASDQASAAQVLSVSADEPHQRVEQEPYTEIPSVDASAQSNHVNLVTANVVTHYEINWQDFQVPWHMLPSSIIANFESGKKESVAQLIHTVIDVARGVSKKISAPAMKIISKKIVDKYPQAFEDRDDDGRTIGDGTHTIFQKLKGRYFYLNDDDGNGGPSPAKKSKKSKNPPEDDEPTLDESNQGEQAVQDSTDQKQLNEYTLKKADEEFYRLLQLCYKRISSYLNQKNTPSLDAVQRNWPVIFKSETIKWFFREQTELDVNLFGEKLSEKAEKILTALYNKKCGFVPVVTKNQPGGLNALERVSVHLKEDFSHFFKSTAFTVSLTFFKQKCICITMLFFLFGRTRIHKKVQRRQQNRLLEPEVERCKIAIPTFEKSKRPVDSTNSKLCSETMKLGRELMQSKL